jgi:hypothetical protein
LYLIFWQVLGLTLLLGRTSSTKDDDLLVLRHDDAASAADAAGGGCLAGDLRPGAAEPQQAIVLGCPETVMSRSGDRERR